MCPSTSEAAGERSSKHAKRHSPASPAETLGAPAPDGEPSPESVARQIVLTALTAAPRTRAELQALLARRNVPAAVVAGVLDRFAEVGLVDDAAFANAWVESRHTGRGLGKRALRAELVRRGVDAQTTTAAVEQLAPADELAAARTLVRRKLGSLERFDPPTRTRRLLGMLARRGYDSSTSWAAIRAEQVDTPAAPIEVD